MLQGEPFIPHDLEGWLRVAATVVGALFGSWAMILAALHKSEVNERKLTDNALMLLRQEHEDAIKQETSERKLADSRSDERIIDIAQKVHVWMGRLDLLTERIHEDRLAQSKQSQDDRLAQAKELAALRLELERGFAAMRDMLHNCPYREDHPPV